MNNTPTLEDLINEKKLTDEQYEKELSKLNKFTGNQNVRCLAGNPIIYHHQIKNLVKVKARKHFTFYEYMNDTELKQKLLDMTIKRRYKITPFNMYQTYSANKNSISFFKPTVSKYIYKYYGATNVLDFTAGWGGRMLGAHSLNISYTGIDSNENMKQGYTEMIDKLKDDKLKMIWGNCLNVDLSKIDFDLVLTSPPYLNLEKYEMMDLFKDKDDFYNNFLIIMLNRCSEHIKNNGWICLNISIPMYNDLTKNYKYKECDEQHILQNSRGPKNLNRKEYIYCWKVDRP